ncbi:hypothetical protein MycrhDRAFT_5525 [Mycolicibacterium rhodesiae JS60]|nr:hypothetical protein MycrhDRAFT_5525 [Mycolicibacterium rhodesiae JS60]
MGAELFAQVRGEVHGLLNHFMADRWREVAPGVAAVADSGVCYMYNEDVSLKAGFGAVAGLEVNAGVLGKLAEVNAFNKLAHVWLRPEDNGGTWAMMVTFKMAYVWTAPEEMRQFMYTVLTNQDQILEIIHGMIAPFGGRPYWNPSGGMEQVDSRGYALASDLGG